MEINSRHNWHIGHVKNAPLDKDYLITRYMRYMLTRCQMIFKYENLPETIPQKDLEFYIQNYGYATITKVNDKLYAFVGGLGGELNEYYLPTLCTVANPYLNFSKALKIGVDSEIILNDSMYLGLRDLFYPYAYLLAETDISIKLGIINSRIKQLIIADNDQNKASADKYIQDIVNGEIGAIMKKSMAEGILTKDYQVASSNELKSLMEIRQYLLSTAFIEIGLNSNFNMKREAINSEETAIGENTLLPLVDNMLLERQKGVERINKMFGTNITVEFNSAWKKIHNEFCVEAEEETNNEINQVD